MYPKSNILGVGLLTLTLAVVLAVSLQEHQVQAEEKTPATGSLTESTWSGSVALATDPAALYSTTAWYDVENDIQRVELRDDGTLHLYKGGGYSYNELIITPTPRSRWKDVYVARDGKIVLDRTVRATVIPAQPERIEWPAGDE